MTFDQELSRRYRGRPFRNWLIAGVLIMPGVCAVVPGDFWGNMIGASVGLIIPVLLLWKADDMENIR